MTIPESQLNTWSNQGAVTTSQLTHTSIRNALASYSWATGVTYDDYLQGSYRNSTNIHGNSDVDLVVELTSVVYSNLTDTEKSSLGFKSANYGWSNFRQDIITALVNYYGANLIDTSGSRSIKVLPSSGRLKADVVVCATYQYYSQKRIIAEGMTFWTMPGRQQIINYPKLHYDNGAIKNDPAHTGWRYKPSIRMFKNARNRLLADKPYLQNHYSSYFIECLLYNVPDTCFNSNCQDTYLKVTKWLRTELSSDRASKFECQNKMTYLFGQATTQWTIAYAQEYVNLLIDLWNNW